MNNAQQMAEWLVWSIAALGATAGFIIVSRLWGRGVAIFFVLIALAGVWWLRGGRI